MPSFALNIAAFVERVKADATIVERRIALDVLAGVVFMTPVDTGRARGNWMVTLGLPYNGYEWDRYDPQGSLSFNEGKAVIETAIAGGPSLWLANNLPYINRLEYDSWSRQAPNGMVRVTLARVQAHMGA